MKDRYSKTFSGWIGEEESSGSIFKFLTHRKEVTSTRDNVRNGMLGKPRKVKVKVTVEIEDAK